METSDDEHRVTQDLSKPLRRIKKFMKFGSIWSQVWLGTAVWFIGLIEIAPILLHTEDFFLPDIITALAIWITVILAFTYWGRKTYQTWFGQAINAFGHAGLFFVFNEMILRQTESIPVFPIINYMGWGLIGCMALGFLFNLFNLLIFMPLLRSKQFKSFKAWLRSIKETITPQSRSLTIGMLFTIILTTTTLVTISPKTLNNTTILIQQQDYDADLAFWASINPAIYNDTVKDELNEHEVTIITYDTPPDITLEPARTSFVNMVKEWNNSYPNVKVMPAVPAPIGGFVWDGETPETIDLAKDYLILADEENLTNVIGLSFDWEKPNNETRVEEYGIETDADRERHEESRQQWHDFFNWKDKNYPDMLIQNVNYVGSSADVFDGDNDIATLKRYNVFDVPRWDEYAPMIYRGSCDGTQPYGDYPYWKPNDAPRSHYWFYSQMKIHAQAVEQVHGDINKLGVYLGITNCTCYGRDVIQVEHGEEMGYGFDALVRDTLIAKHFGSPIITLFILNTVPTSSDPEDYHSMGGVFDTWGPRFLDDFNESINGEDSRK